MSQRDSSQAFHPLVVVEKGSNTTCEGGQELRVNERGSRDRKNATGGYEQTGDAPPSACYGTAGKSKSTGLKTLARVHDGNNKRLTYNPHVFLLPETVFFL